MLRYSYPTIPVHLPLLLFLTSLGRPSEMLTSTKPTLKNSIIDWEALSSICKEEEFPQLFTLILLQMCELYCPRKASPRVQSASSTHIHSRKKRKLAKQLEEAKSNANCPQARIDSLRRKVALAHLDIRDAINEDLLCHEQQAVSKVKENPKFFFSYSRVSYLCVRSRENVYFYFIDTTQKH